MGFASILAGLDKQIDRIFKADGAWGQCAVFSSDFGLP